MNVFHIYRLIQLSPALTYSGILSPPLRHQTLIYFQSLLRHESRFPAILRLSTMTLNAPPNGGIDPQTARSKNVDNHRSTYSNVQQNWSKHDGDRETLRKPRYPHIKDLQARADAVIRELSAVMPVCSGFYTSIGTGPSFCLVHLTLRCITDSYPFGACKTIGKSSQHQCQF